MVDDGDNQAAEATNPYDDEISPFRSPNEHDTNGHSYFVSGIHHSNNVEQRPQHRRGTDASHGGSQQSLGPFSPASGYSNQSRSPSLAPQRPSIGAFSFDLDIPQHLLSREPGRSGSVSPGGSNRGSGGSRRGSAFSSGSAAENALDILRDSAWGESLRRSYTQRRSQDGRTSPGGGARGNA